MTLDSDSPLEAQAPPAEAAPLPEPAPGGEPPARRMGSPPVVGLVMLVVGLALGYFGRPVLEARFAPPPASSGVQGPHNLPQSQDDLLPYLISQTRHFKGSPDAPVTVIEMADYQCPFCGLHEAGAGRQIDAQYVAAGQVRVGYQHFAFLGPESNWAAEASECAADQNKFWDYHDLLYANQDGENRGAFNWDKLKQFAASLGLNTEAFNDCVDSGKYTALVASQTRNLQMLGVQSTPTFLVNTQPLVGAQSFETFQQLIDQELLK